MPQNPFLCHACAGNRVSCHAAGCRLWATLEQATRVATRCSRLPSCAGASSVNAFPSNAGWSSSTPSCAALARARPATRDSSRRRSCATLPRAAVPVMPVEQQPRPAPEQAPAADAACAAINLGVFYITFPCPPLVSLHSGGAAEARRWAAHPLPFILTLTNEYDKLSYRTYNTYPRGNLWLPQKLRLPSIVRSLLN
jgi:hypothetical protein